MAKSVTKLFKPSRNTLLHYLEIARAQRIENDKQAYYAAVEKWRSDFNFAVEKRLRDKHFLQLLADISKDWKEYTGLVPTCFNARQDGMPVYPVCKDSRAYSEAVAILGPEPKEPWTRNHSVNYEYPLIDADYARLQRIILTSLELSIDELTKLIDEFAKVSSDMA